MSHNSNNFSVICNHDLSLIYPCILNLGWRLEKKLSDHERNVNCRPESRTVIYFVLHRLGVQADRTLQTKVCWWEIDCKKTVNKCEKNENSPKVNTSFHGPDPLTHPDPRIKMHGKCNESKYRVVLQSFPQGHQRWHRLSLNPEYPGGYQWERCDKFIHSSLDWN